MSDIEILFQEFLKTLAKITQTVLKKYGYRSYVYQGVSNTLGVDYWCGKNPGTADRWLILDTVVKVLKQKRYIQLVRETTNGYDCVLFLKTVPDINHAVLSISITDYEGCYGNVIGGFLSMELLMGK